MVLIIKEITEIIKNKDKESIKQIISIIKVNLERINLMEREKWNFPMEIYMKVNLSIIYLMAKESILMVMVINMLDNGRRDKNMESGNLHIKILEMFMMVIGLKTKKKEMEDMSTKREMFMWVDSKMT